MKKVIFLDFDGVLVTDRYQMQLLDDGVQLHVDEYGARFDPVCVENLRRIIDSTDADIVIPSTWKMRLGLEGLQKMWDARRLPGKVIGVTPDIDPIHRGNEIEAWLDACGEVCHYAIIDDCLLMEFFREEQLPYIFKVDERTGLDEKTARKIIDNYL